MSFRSGRGFTLVEVLVASAIGLMVLGIIYQLVSFSRMASSTAQQSYVLGQDAATAFRTIQRELSETSLASVVVGTWKSPAGQLPSFSLLSAREKTGLKFGPDGVPRWVREINYRLEPSAKDPDTGVVVRRERELPEGGLPFPQPVHDDLSAEQGRPILLGVLLPGKTLKPGKSGLAEVQSDPDAEGGFRLRFVRRDAASQQESYSTVNPGSRSDLQVANWTASSTRLLRLVIGILETDTSTGKPGYVELQLSICPSHE